MCTISTMSATFPIDNIDVVKEVSAEPAVGDFFIFYDVSTQNWVKISWANLEAAIAAV